jgi:plastocyanin
MSFLFLTSCTSEPETTVPVVHTIVISSMQFNPAELTLQKGDTVVFVNKDLVVHDITQDPEKSWTSSNLSPGQSYRMAIRVSSDYYCSIHPTMKGKLVVQP